MKIPLSAPNLCGRELDYVNECIRSNWISGAGEFIRKFEVAVCNRFKIKNAVSCVNGTSALLLALELSGVETGDEVIVPTVTFISPVNAVRHRGAAPIFMDCDEYLNIDVEKLQDFCRKECKMTARGLINKTTGRIIKAIIPVHVFGNPCRMEEVCAAAREFRLSVIEDAAESLGSYYTCGKFSGKFTGSIGDFGVYSFNANKVVTSAGGGMILSRKKTVSKKARYLIDQAKDDPVRYIHREAGYNLRLSNLHAAVGLAQLELLGQFLAIKRKNLELYRKLISPIAGLSFLEPPPGTRANLWFYPLLIEKEIFGRSRQETMKAFSNNNIETRPLWKLNHLQRPYLKCQSYKIDKAPRLFEKIINLPCGTGLREREIEEVVSVLVRLKGKNGKN
ncbi:MAG: LegC family aminotransferase [Candidatus Omnitrophica bacterium]|nr:LegC family aminotransferase [Candidatus Omnitrophota bacterium]